MPINLNALLRYKTIDGCLKNTNAQSSIQFLVNECSAALYEANGHNSGVSERTIRNDIRVMRSSLLGFNAPIEVKNGIYYYANPEYNLFKTSFEDKSILISIQELLIEEFDNIKNNNLPFLLKKLTELTKKDIPEKYLPKEKKTDPNILEKNVSDLYSSALYKFSYQPKSKKYLWSKKKLDRQYIWGYIFRAI